MFGSAPLEFHWRTCCLWGKHLKHLNSATTHWSTPDGEPGSNTRGDSEWHFVANNFFSDQILFFRAGIDHSFHFQAETLEWTGHLNGLSTQCSTRDGGTMADMEWWEATNNCDSLEHPPTNSNTHQQTNKEQSWSKAIIRNKFQLWERWKAN